MNIIRPYIKNLVYLEQTDSTNTRARQLLEQGGAVGEKIIVVTAGRQTAGRGRMERSFFSSVDGGLWTSLIIGLDSLDRHFSINRALSLAICQTVSRHADNRAAIKWPNDIYCGTKKICGILLETAAQHTDAIIAGFGLNVNVRQADFPPDIRQIATSLYIETSRQFDLQDLLTEILDQFQAFRVLPSGEAHGLYCRHLYRIGDTIDIDGEKGIFDGVEEDGQLKMRKAGGDIKKFLSGTLRFTPYE